MRFVWLEYRDVRALQIVATNLCVRVYFYPRTYHSKVKTMKDGRRRTHAEYKAVGSKKLVVRDDLPQ